MDPERWARIQELFDGVLECPPEDRDAWLEERVRDEDPAEARALLDEVRSLLENDGSTVGILDAGVSPVARGVLDGASTPPAEAGPYRILGFLGEGGMGVVYLAERTDVGQRVALKMLRDAWLSPMRRARFELEERSLAQLRHPGIAQLHDVGVLPGGTPWFAMELVEGLSLTAHCRERREPLAERLALFRQACRAVAHAHGRAILHRDLKPSNILVTPEGQVKLLDFGIARHMEADVGTGELTRTALRLLTPSYASPEQLRGDPPGLYTDVYALGVILYELLAGRRPHDLTGLSAVAAERRLIDEDPLPPSKNHGEGGIPDAPDRGAWSELDTICLTALHKDADRRYPTVEALLRDLEHFERTEPLEARPDSAAYRTRRFLRRRRRELGAALAFGLVLLGLSGFYAWSLSEERTAARDAAAQADQVSEYLIGLFQAGDPTAPGPETTDLAGVLARGVAQVDELADQPALQAGFLDVLGRVHMNLSRYPEAEDLLQRALELRRASPPRRAGAGALELAGTLSNLGVLRRYAGDLAGAEMYLREAVELRAAHVPPDDLDLAGALDELGVVLSNQGHYEDAEALQRQALEIRAAGIDGPSLVTATSLNNLGVTLANRGEYAEAAELLRSSLEMGTAVLGPDHPNVASDLANLGVVLEILGDMAGADSALTEALRIKESRLGRDHYETALAMTQLGGTLHRTGQLARAEDLLRGALDIERRILDPGHRNTGITRIHLAGVLQDREAWPEALPLLEEGLEILTASLGPEHEFTATTRCRLADLHRTMGSHTESETLFRRCLGELGAVVSADHDVLAGFQVAFGRLLLEVGRAGEAEPYLRDAFRTLEARFGPDHPSTRRAGTAVADLDGVLAQSR